MRNQKGFTLIELMATLGILALIIAIAVPVIGSIMNDAEAGSKKASISMIEEAGKLAHLGGLAFDTGKRYTVPTLVKEGYLNLSEENDLYSQANYVEQQANGAFTFVEVTPNPASDFMYVLYDNNTKVAIARYKSTDKKVVIPSMIEGKPVTQIGSNAFENKGLTSVVIPNTVTDIGDWAFSQNALTQVIIPNSVTRIGKHAFWSSGLTSVRLSDSVTHIEDSAFANNNLTQVTIPASVEVIGRKAFELNELGSIVIPVGVTTIKEYAFAFNNLETITVLGADTLIESNAFANNPTDYPVSESP